MSVDRIKQALTAVRYPVSSSLSLPPECYHDDGWLEHEMNCLFRRGWFAIGRRDQWQNPGDYQAIEVAGAPIVVVVDQDGLHVDIPRLPDHGEIHPSGTNRLLSTCRMI